MLSIGPLEHLLRTIAEQTAHGLLTIGPYGGQARSRRNAEQAADAVARERREREEVSAWLADYHPAEPSQ
ncbi:hypothetical protein [Streptomyces brasiliensis]|uniref:Uncharacterized protein n=1 Tax=Streptomyces brasiliensis TaxID=1954 RepID=A0A917PDE8_9ACTN|nr:hypothetical protein [Streptomyces brasiliensis]GGJ71792.1 hypothetical protein GCM10010121_098000 [Streptomyces brasiliensis]